MKTLKEKKMLANFARMLGEPVDPGLLKSIEEEERLSKMFFKEQKEPEVVAPELPVEIVQEVAVEPEIIIEVTKPVEVAQTGIVPPEKTLIQQTMNTLSNIKPVLDAAPKVNVRDKEIEGLKRAIADLVRKVGTLSMGSGGSGSVLIRDMSDFDRNSYSNGRYMRWANGTFFLDEVNPHDVVYNTTTVAGDEYTVQDEDYYIGVTHTGAPTTIHLPSVSSPGRVLVIKDETGQCSINNIIITGTVDNDAGGMILAIDNAGVQIIYRDGWRII
ncbi:hypothetical protein UFOVP49_124 [uncultured Caudovirales phage]|uniref:Uncharacterized protein n=1 Tax=uncultured Caudovirales phage TaxID=2100421 RepID=A0A6J5KSS5_9CAUD|nr:hypothetical protein UFOVP49_124 [uncultured Caudovirales phage]